MADTPEQAEIRRQLAARGNALAPRASEGAARTRDGAAERPKRASRAATSVATTVAAPEAKTVSKTVSSTQARRQTQPRAPGGGAGPRAGGAGGAGQRSRRPSRSQRAGKRAYASLAGRASGGVLLAEFFAAAFIIAFSLFTKGPNKGYASTMPDIILRLSALTGVFFVLFLVAGSEKGGKAAAWFGLLVDIAVAINAYKDSFFTTLTSVVQGQGTGVESATLTASTSLTEPKPDTVLPDE